MGAVSRHPWTKARFYRGGDGRSRCELTNSLGDVHPADPRPISDDEVDGDAIPWCRRAGVEVVDERTHSLLTLQRLVNEAALYNLEHWR